MNDNEMLADFCSDFDCVIDKATWVSPNSIIEKQIDHIYLSRKFGRSLLAVRVNTGADAESDHNLLIAKVRMKLKRCYTPLNPRVTNNVRFFKDREIRKKQISSTSGSTQRR